MIGRGGQLVSAPVRGEQPDRIAMRLPVLAQHLKRAGRQRHVAVLRPLARVYVHHHPRAVDVGHLQVQRFVQPQTTGVHRPKIDAVPRRSRGPNDRVHFFERQHIRQSPLPLGANQCERGPIAFHGVRVEEADADVSDLQRTGGELLVVLEVLEVIAHFIFLELVGRSPVEFSELPHGAEVSILGASTEPAKLQIAQHRIAQSSHERLLSGKEGKNVHP